MADSLLKEVDEALRADRAASLWNQYKRTIITIAVVLVVATAAKSGWQSYREARGGEMLAKLSEAKNLIVAEKPAEAAKQFAEIAAGASGELKALALVWQSRAELAGNNKEAAAKALTDATATGANLWADVACLRLAGLDAAAAKPCLNASSNSPLKAERAQWAAAGAWAEGDKDAATKSLEAMIADEKTSVDERERLTQWLAVVKPQEQKQ
jgi:hypothetical protein